MPYTIQRSFTGGEISPALRARADTAKYASGLALCKNFIVRPQGGVYSRPGTRFVGYLGNPSAPVRLIPFSFNTEQTYILVLQSGTLRVVRDGGFVLNPGGDAYEISTPYINPGEINQLKYTQDADVMTLVHPNHPPYTLSRYGELDWRLEPVSFDPTINPPVWPVYLGPGLQQARVAMSSITATAPVEVTTNTAHLFNTGMRVVVSINETPGVTIGEAVELDGRSFEITVIDSTRFTLSGTDGSSWVNTDVGVTSWVDNRNVVVVGANPSGESSVEKNHRYVVTAVSSSGAESLPSATVSKRAALGTGRSNVLQWAHPTILPHGDDALYFRVYKELSPDSEVFGWIGDSAVPAFVDANLAPVTSISPPRANNPFNAVGKYPSVTGYYQQRQVYAGSRNNPQTMWFSQIADYDSFRSSSPTRDDDAIEFTLRAGQVNAIRHIIELDSLVILTSGGAWRVTEGQDQVLTPATVGARLQSNLGASHVPPVLVGDSIIYVQDKGGRLRDIKYNFVDDRYGGDDLSIMAEHLFSGRSVDSLAWCAEPYGILWCAMSDGSLLGLTYQREHQVWAWHQHVTDGHIRSIASIPEDGRDALYMAVRRRIDGDFVTYIERMEPRILPGATDPDDAAWSFCVDCGVSYVHHIPYTVVPGLDHLIGREVAVVADGVEVAGLTVSAEGTITLPHRALRTHVGIPYECAIETLDIDVASPTETLRGNVKSISRVMIDVEQSRGGWVSGKIDRNDMYNGDAVELKPRFDSDNYNPLALKTFRDEVIIPSRWSKGGGVRIEQRAPFPLAILSVIPNVDIG